MSIDSLILALGSCCGCREKLANVFRNQSQEDICTSKYQTKGGGWVETEIKNWKVFWNFYFFFIIVLFVVRSTRCNSTREVHLTELLRIHELIGHKIQPDGSQPGAKKEKHSRRRDHVQNTLGKNRASLSKHAIVLRLVKSSMEDRRNQTGEINRKQRPYFFLL